MANSVRQITVKGDDHGQRLDNFLIRVLKGVPRSRVYKMIRKGEVRVNGKRSPAHYKLQTKDKLRVPPVYTKESQQTRPPDRFLSKIQQSILYVDDELIVLNKPAGMAVHKGSGIHYGIVDALPWLRTAYHSVSLVHRLDRDTSGCLVLARNRQALKALHRQLRDFEMAKYYRVLVKGHWSEAKTINAPLRKQRGPGGEPRVTAVPNGDQAQTHFKPLRWFQNATFMQACPVTGRMHQIRVHAAFAGHPPAGDLKYGDKSFNNQLKRLGFNRLFLHAYYIGFYHPRNNEWTEITAPMDDLLLTVLKRLK